MAERKGIRVRPTGDPLNGWVGYPEASHFQMHDDGDLLVYAEGDEGDEVVVAGWARGQWAAVEHWTPDA